MLLKKKMKLTAELKKAYFSGIAYNKMAYIVSSLVVRLFDVDEPYRLVLNTNFRCLGSFVTFSITLLVC